MGSGNAVEKPCLCKAISNTQQTNTTTPNVPKKGYTHKTIPRRICSCKTCLCAALRLKNNFGLKFQFIFCRKIPLRIIQSKPKYSAKSSFEIFRSVKTYSIAHPAEPLRHGLREYRSYATFAESETWLRRNRPPDKRNALRTNIQLNPEVKKEIHLEMSRRRSAMIVPCVRRVFPQKHTHTHKTNTKKSICDYGFCDGTKAFLNAKTIFKRSTQLRSG